MAFDKATSKLAVTIPQFTMKKLSDPRLAPIGKNYAEPYIVSVAVDEHGLANPSLEFNSIKFPKVGWSQAVNDRSDR